MWPFTQYEVPQWFGKLRKGTKSKLGSPRYACPPGTMESDHQPLQYVAVTTCGYFENNRSLFGKSADASN